MFITEGPSPEDNEKGKQKSPPPPTSSTCEEIPLVTVKEDTTNSQEVGLFSAPSTAKQNSSLPSSLIMGASPSSSSMLLKGDKEHHCGSGGFKPLIEVVSSSQQCNSDSNAEHLTKPSHSKLASLSDKATTISTAPEATKLETGGRWASSTKPERLATKPGSRMESGGLLIEEIDDNADFNVGRLPLTADEQAAIAKTDAALEKIKNRPISELSEEERVWYLAASAGSTLDSGAELDEETKTRLRERLRKTGLVDKTSLKF